MDKPFRTVREQMGLLESRGVKLDEGTLGVLEREGYYSVVNGYKEPFLDRLETQRANDDRFAFGTTFAYIYRLFLFDRDLRLTMFRYFSQAEASLKTVCAYHFAARHPEDVEAYLKRENYTLSQSYDRRVELLINDLKKIVHKSPYEDGSFKREYIKHYVMRHDGVPLWVLTNFLTLGQAFKFYEFQCESLQNEIARAFSNLYQESYDETIRVSPKMLRISYDHIKDFRNICAHDERLYCARVSPSRDTRFVALMSDLRIVLTKPEYTRMQHEVSKLIHGLMEDVNPRVTARVVEAMGIRNIGQTAIAS